MKATGIIRRLDDLGRLVIPKEIRKTYRLKEGDSIEFFISDDAEIILKKFSVLSEEKQMICAMCELLQQQLGHSVYYIQDGMVVACGSREELSRHVSERMEEKVRVYHVSAFTEICVFSDDLQESEGTIFPVVIHGDWMGSFVVVEKEKRLKPEQMDVIQSFVRLLIRMNEH